MKMNKLIAFIGGVVVGVVYSDDIKQVYSTFKYRKAKSLAKEINDEVTKQIEKCSQEFGSEKDLF